MTFLFDFASAKEEVSARRCSNPQLCHYITQLIIHPWVDSVFLLWRDQGWTLPLQHAISGTPGAFTLKLVLPLTSRGLGKEQACPC